MTYKNDWSWILISNFICQIELNLVPKKLTQVLPLKKKFIYE